MREATGLTQQQLSEKCGLTQGVIGRLERNRIENSGEKTIKALAKGFGLPYKEMDEIFHKNYYFSYKTEKDQTVKVKATIPKKKQYSDIKAKRILNLLEESLDDEELFVLTNVAYGLVLKKHNYLCHDVKAVEEAVDKIEKDTVEPQNVVKFDPENCKIIYESKDPKTIPIDAQKFYKAFGKSFDKLKKESVE